MSTNLDPHVYALRRTSIACLSLPGDNSQVYFQDFDGCIREVQYRAGRGYLGGNKNSIVEKADDVKYHGPVAAVASQDPSQQITLFYVSRDNTLRGLIFDGQGWKPFYSLNQMGVPVCPASQLATLRYNKDSDIRIYYQHEDKTVKELCYSGATSEWTYSDLSLPAVVGSSLSCAKWLNDDGSLREIMFFYQDPTCEVRSHFYVYADGKWDYGYLHVPNMPQGCGISSAAHRHLGFGADIARIYTIEPSGKIAERSFRSDTEEWSHAEFTQSLLEGKIAATWFPLNDNPEIRLFYQGPAGELKGYNFQGRAWQNEHTLPCGD